MPVADVNRVRVIATPPIDRDRFVPILLTGQSNAELPNYQTAARETNVLTLSPLYGFDYAAKYRPEFGRLPFQFSFAVRAAADLSAVRSAQYLIIPVARGGTALSNWLPSSNRYDRNTLFGEACFRAALASARTPEAIWYFGHESSINPPDIDRYISLWRSVITEYQKEVGAIPVIYAQLARSTNVDWNLGQFRVAELQRQSEMGQVQGTAGHHMVVTFDLPLGDVVHLSGAANDELGKRFALAMRQHVYGEAVNGTGPRLEGLFHDRSNPRFIEVRFDRTIRGPVNSYDRQFELEGAAGPIPIVTVERGANGRSVWLEIDSAAGPPLYRRYGAKAAPRPGDYLTNAVRDLDGLPAPRFGPLEVPGFVP